MKCAFATPIATPRAGPRRAWRHNTQCCATANTKSEARKAERRALSNFEVAPFLRTLRRAGVHELRRRAAHTLQVNIGLTCDLACRHCHVESSPARSETMPRYVAERLVELAARASALTTVDITGGAPELHEQFRYLVREMRALGKNVIDRCNLVVLEEPHMQGMAQFLADHDVQVVASLPCYSAENVEKQRGDGVFENSIAALKRLNRLGYGTQRELNLVYNPQGASLPGRQQVLEAQYKQMLWENFGIVFNRLICITNMPIKRFADDLIRSNQMSDYLHLLVENFNAQTVDSVMCTDMVHVAYDGRIFDCDFNYALELNALRADGDVTRALNVFDIDSLDDLVNRRIRTDTHCYGCTAGSGSSCGGSLVE